MTIEIAMRLSGVPFLFILFTLAASIAFGIKLGDLNSDDSLQEINEYPKKFQASIILSIIEGVRIIALAIMLFIAFSPYNLILGVVWTICRIGEGLILIYSQINYWGLLKLVRQYSNASDAEKNALSDAGRIILQTKNSRWTFATTLFGIGTLAYSILFITYGLVPSIIGWLGIIAGILLIFDSGIKLVKPELKVSGILEVFSGLLAILFEVILGGWLLFYSDTIL